MNRIYAETLMDEILTIQAEIANGNDYAAGIGLGDLRKLLKEYAIADFVIVRVAPDQRPFCISLAELEGQCYDRLLVDGTWRKQEVK